MSDTNTSTPDAIKSYLASQSEPQDANAIAAGTGISVSTIRKNLAKMREAGEVNANKVGHSQVYSLPEPIIATCCFPPEEKGNSEAEASNGSDDTGSNGLSDDTDSESPTVEESAYPADVPATATVEEGLTLSDSDEGEGDVIVNPEATCTPRLLVAKLRERAEKHRKAMEAATTPQDYQYHRKLLQRRQRRLEQIIAQHPEVEEFASA